MTVEDTENFEKSNFTKFVNEKFRFISTDCCSANNSKFNLKLFKKSILDFYDNKNKTPKKDYHFYMEQYTLVSFLKKTF